MSKTRLALAALAACAAPPVFAEAAPPAPDYTLAANVGLFSDYRFRGLSMTNKKPAVQGGIDFAHRSGWYLGNWNSNVDSGLFNGANVEMDFYGGWKISVQGFGLDLGAIYYYYPGSGDNPGTGKIDNTELYLGGSWGPIALKFNYAVSDFFGVADSKGSYYVLLGGGHDFGNGFGVNAAVGYQGGLKNGACYTQMNGRVSCSVTDYKLGGTYTIDGWVLGLAYVTTNRDISLGTAAGANRNISNGTAVASVSKSF